MKYFSFRWENASELQKKMKYFSSVAGVSANLWVLLHCRVGGGTMVKPIPKSSCEIPVNAQVGSGWVATAPINLLS